MHRVADYATSGVVPFLIGTLLIGGVLVVMMRRASTGIRVFREGFITGITGRKGNGKSLFSVHDILRHLGQPVYCRKCTRKPELRAQYGAYPGKLLGRGKWFHTGHVATNTSLKVPAELQRYVITVTDWPDLAQWDIDDKGELTITEKLPHGTLCFLDEVQLWFRARAGEVLPPRQALFLAQLRKLVLELVYVTQSLGNVAIGLRRQTDEIGICKKGLFKQFIVKFYDPEQLGSTNRPGRGEKSLWTFRYRINPRTAAAYDTYEVLLPASSDDVVEEVVREVGPTRKPKGGAQPPRHEAGARPNNAKRSQPTTLDTDELDRRMAAVGIPVATPSASDN